MYKHLMFHPQAKILENQETEGKFVEKQLKNRQIHNQKNRKKPKNYKNLLKQKLKKVMVKVYIFLLKDEINTVSDSSVDDKTSMKPQEKNEGNQEIPNDITIDGNGDITEQEVNDTEDKVNGVEEEAGGQKFYYKVDDGDDTDTDSSSEEEKPVTDEISEEAKVNKTDGNILIKR